MVLVESTRGLLKGRLYLILESRLWDRPQGWRVAQTWQPSRQHQEVWAGRSREVSTVLGNSSIPGPPLPQKVKAARLTPSPDFRVRADVTTIQCVHVDFPCKKRVDLGASSRSSPSSELGRGWWGALRSDPEHL